MWLHAQKLRGGGAHGREVTDAGLGSGEMLISFKANEENQTGAGEEKTAD